MRKIAYFALTTFFVFLLLYYIMGFFQVYHHPVPSKHLLLEGWLSSKSIEQAVQYINNNDIDSIWIISMKRKNNISGNSGNVKIKGEEIKDKKEKLNIAWNGILIYQIPAGKINDYGVLKINMYGTKVNEIFPHYKVVLDNKLLKQGFVTGSDSVYTIGFEKLVADKAVNLMINFDNDAMAEGADRNLFINKVFIDSLEINNIITKKFFLNYSKVFPFFESDADDIKLYFSGMGINPEKIQIIETGFKSINGTLALASKAGEYFQNSQIKDLNIFAEYHHSRRSFLNFRNCINKNIKIGCIALEAGNDKNWINFKRDIDERVSLLVSWVYWWFH